MRTLTRRIVYLRASFSPRHYYNRPSGDEQRSSPDAGHVVGGGGLRRGGGRAHVADGQRPPGAVRPGLAAPVDRDHVDGLREQDVRPVVELLESGCGRHSRGGRRRDDASPPAVRRR